MPTGRLGSAAPAAATTTTLFTVAAGKTAVFSLSACNRGTTAALVRVALAATATPTAAEYIEYDVSVPANGVLERTGLLLDAGKLVVVQASTDTVSFVAFGYEE